MKWCPKKMTHVLLSWVIWKKLAWRRLKKVEEFENDEIEILRLKAGYEKLETICLHHEYILVTRFPVTQTNICDLLKKHKIKSWKRKPSGKFKFQIFQIILVLYEITLSHCE